MAEADFMSCFSRVESKVMTATYSKVSIGTCVTKMIFSTFSPLLILCSQHNVVARTASGF